MDRFRVVKALKAMEKSSATVAAKGVVPSKPCELFEGVFEKVVELGTRGGEIADLPDAFFLGVLIVTRR